jgi:hypothetical protein
MLGSALKRVAGQKVKGRDGGERAGALVRAPRGSDVPEVARSYTPLILKPADIGRVRLP